MPSTGESLLRLTLQRLFPDYTPKLNYKHPSLVHSSGFRMELDIFFSEISLAFEYHGKQHFHDSFRGNLGLQVSRDQEKMEACQNNNITLIVVPYWWNGSFASLVATILQAQPDISLPAGYMPPSSSSSDHSPSASSVSYQHASAFVPISRTPPALAQLHQQVNSDPASVQLKLPQYYPFLDPTSK